MFNYPKEKKTLQFCIQTKISLLALQGPDTRWLRAQFVGGKPKIPPAASQHYGISGTLRPFPVFF
jgi:hypothetical protein